MAWRRLSDSRTLAMKSKFSPRVAFALGLVLLFAVVFRVWLNAREAGAAFLPTVHLHRH